MKREHIVSLAAVVLISAALAAAGEPKGSPPATKPADRIAPFLKVIREVEDYRAVMRAYARATAIDANDVRVQEAYMRRMLQLGLPQIAYYPALTLTRLDGKNSLAWGVVGYVHGRRGELKEAFAATIRAMAKLPDDPSILHNAGQLAAWYDTDPSLPKVPDSVRMLLAKRRGKLEKNPVFAKAYKRIVEAYKKRDQAGTDLDKKLAVAESDARATQRLAREVDRQLKDLNDEIDYRNRLIDQLYRELRYYYGYYYTYVRNSDGVYVAVPTYDRVHRRELYDRIQDEERAIEGVKLKVRRVRREGRAVLGELARKQAPLEKIRKQLRRHALRVEREFRWDPPAVDGVVTPELDGLPSAARSSGVKVPVDPESEASQRLDLARLYLRHEMHDKALAILREIVEHYGSTPSAKQAKLLLAALKPID